MPTMPASPRSSSRSVIPTTRSSSGWGRATRTASTARRRRRWPRSSRCSWPSGAVGVRGDRVVAHPRGPRRWRPRSADMARPSARSTSRCTTWSARSRACRSTCCAASPRSCRRPTSPSASTSRPSSPSELPGPPTSRPSRSSAVARPTSPRCARSVPSSPGRSGSTRTPAGRVRTPRRCSPS